MRRFIFTYQYDNLLDNKHELGIIHGCLFENGQCGYATVIGSGPSGLVHADGEQDLIDHIVRVAGGNKGSVFCWMDRE